VDYGPEIGHEEIQDRLRVAGRLMISCRFCRFWIDFDQDLMIHSTTKSDSKRLYIMRGVREPETKRSGDREMMMMGAANPYEQSARRQKHTQQTANDQDGQQ
jgi:hypothetical protein